MAGFDVQILLRLVDKLTAPARKAGQSYQNMANDITRSSKQIQTASANAVAGVNSIGAAATRANAQINTAMSNVRRLQAQTAANARGTPMVVGGDRGVFGALGAWMALRSTITAGEDSARAENKFRALVDDATPKGMLEIRKKLDARMMRTGESYAELLGAAGDAAQIVGRSNIAADIAISASKLANIDTAGKDVAAFAENLAAVIGPKGTLQQLSQMSDMLAVQQKLGAATAGGTIEAYKNVVGLKDIYRFDTADMLTSIGLIKNAAPALQDSQIGNMAKYGLRTLAAPIADMKKKLAAVGLSPEVFMSDGAFDVAKTQRIFHEMTQTEKGMRQFRDLFAGKNVLAGQYWSFLATIDPAKFAKYREELTGSAGVLDDADMKRLQGLVGALNAIRGAAFKLARTFGELLTPAIESLSRVLAPAVGWFSDMVGRMRSDFPVLTSVVSHWLTLSAALGAFGLVSTRAAAAARWLFRLPFLLFTGELIGTFAALSAGGKSFIRMTSLAYRFGGALGVAAMAFRTLRRLTMIGLAVEGLVLVYTHWKDLVEIAKDPIHLTVLWPEMPDWLKWIVDRWSELNKGVGFAAGFAKEAVLGAIDVQQGLPAGASVTPPLPGASSLRIPLPERPQVRVPLPERSNFRSSLGVPEAVAKSLAANSAGKAPSGITIQADGPQVLVKQAPPNINITNNVVVNAQANASPEAIGAAAASAVGNKVRGALSDAPLSAP